MTYFAGVLSGAFCTSAYHRYTTKAPISLYLVSLAIISFSSICAVAGNYNLLGSLGCVLAVILMGSPLATVRTVIKDKSTAALPFATSMSGWLNALAWSSYGWIVAKDAMIYGPNLVGFTLATFQLMLFVIYGFPKNTALSSQVPKEIF